MKAVRFDTMSKTPDNPPDVASVGLTFLETGHQLVNIYGHAEELTTPLLLKTIEGTKVFTHHIDGAIFGTETTLKRYQQIRGCIEEQWPALSKSMNDLLPRNRVAIFTTDGSSGWESLKPGGAWEDLGAQNPCLKQFNGGVVIDVNGAKSTGYISHKWVKEVQILNAFEQSHSLRELPINLGAFMSVADEREIVKCWWGGFEKCKNLYLPIEDPRQLIYRQPGQCYEAFCKAKQVGDIAKAQEAWAHFTHEIGSQLTSAKLQYDHTTIEQHASELGKCIDSKLGVMAFTEPCPRQFARQMKSFVTANLGRILNAVGLGFDVYGEYHFLPSDTPNRGEHALIKGTVRNLMGNWHSLSGMSEASLHDTSALGSSREAIEKIQNEVGEDRLKSILLKGHQARLREQECAFMRPDQALYGEERDIYFTYMNAAQRKSDEFFQKPLTEIYDKVKKKLTSLFNRPPSKEYLEAVRTCGKEINALLADRSIWDPEQHRAIAEDMQKIADRVFSDLEQRSRAPEPSLALAASSSSASDAAAQVSVGQTRLVYPLQMQEGSEGEHPLARELKCTQQEAKDLTAALNAAIQEERPVDSKMLERVEKLVETCDKASLDLEKQWNQKTEYYVKSMQCMETVANQLHQNNQKSRQERAQREILNANQKAFDHRKDLLRETVASDIRYAEYDRFSYDHFHPRGFMTYTILDIRRNTESLLSHRAELQRRHSLRQDALQSCDQLFQDMDRNDKSFQEDMQRQLRTQQVLSRGLRHLTTILGTAVGIMTIIGCPASYTASIAAAKAIADLGEGVIGKKTDRILAKYQERQVESLQQYERLAQTAGTQRSELTAIEEQLQRCEQVFLSQSTQFDSKGRIKGLQKILSDDESKIGNLERAQVEYKDKLENADSNVEMFAKATANKSNGRLVELFNEEKREQLQLNGLIKSNGENIDKLSKKISDTQKKLEQELFLASMKDQIEEVILAEQQKVDFEKHSTDDFEKGIRAGDLTHRGLAEQQMRISFAAYNEARMMEHQLVSQGSQAARGLLQELDHVFGRNDLGIAIDLGTQLYHLYDRLEYFEKSAGPQFQKFVEALNFDDSKSFGEKLLELHGVELVAGYFIPGMQVITASFGIIRLIQAFRADPTRLNPQQQFLVDVLNKKFESHQRFLHEHFKVIHHHLEQNQVQLTQALDQFRNDLGFVLKEVLERAEKAKEEILQNQRSQDFENYTFKIDARASEWEERDRIFHANFEWASAEKKEIKALKYLGKLDAALSSCLDPAFNGRTSSGHSKWVERFTRENMARAPRYVSSLLAVQIGLEVSIPNVRLFEVVRGCVDRLAGKCLSKSFETCLNDLRLRLDKLKDNLDNLASRYRAALDSSLQARNRYAEEILEVTRKTRLIGLSKQKDLVRRQIDSLLEVHEDEWLGDGRIGERKFFLADLVHRTPLAQNFRLNLPQMECRLGLKETHRLADRGFLMGGVAGGGLGLIGGPAGVVVGMAVGGGVSYSGLAISSLFCTFVKDVSDWVNGGLGQQRQGTEEIQQQLGTSLSALQARESPLGNDRSRVLDIRVEYAGERRGFEITAVTISSLAANYNVFQTGQRSPGRPLIAAWVSADVRRGQQSFPREVQFTQESLIQHADIERIAPTVYAPDYMDRSRRMLTSYFDCLRSLQREALMVDDNPFKMIAAKSNVIPSTTGEFLPLAMPKTLLREIEKNLLADSFELLATETAALFSSFHFRQEPSGGRYEFVLDVQVTKSVSEGAKEYCSFILGVFDRDVVESFRRITFEGEQREEYAIGQPNLQEFLIQAWYGNLFDLGLPGRGTQRLQNVELYVAQEVPFPGLWELYEGHPDRALHYTSRFAGINPARLFGNKFVQQRSLNVYRFWLDAQEIKRAPESLETAAKVYAQNYYLAKALYGLSHDIDPDSLDETFLQRESLFSPKQPELARAQALLSQIDRG